MKTTFNKILNISLVLISLIVFGGKAFAVDYVKVTDASKLAIGDEIIIVSEHANKALSTTQNGNNRGAVAVTISSNTISNPSNVEVITLGKTSSNWTFYAPTPGGTAGYLYAASSSSNYLRTQASNDANGQWTISISSGNATITAQGSNSHKLMQYNTSKSIFSCYTGTQTNGSIQIYKKTASSYTVTIAKNQDSWGTVSANSVTNVAPNTSISASSNVLTVGGTTITATAHAQDADYNYAFSSWSDIPAGGKVTGNITVTANFTRTERALTNYRTSCCTPLGSINGSFNVTKEGCTPTQLKATWFMKANTGIASQTLKVYKKGGTYVKDVNIATVPTSEHTETIDGLDPCTEYYVELWSNSAGGNFCADEKVATSSDVETGSYSVSYTGSTNVNHSDVTTACASADLSITFSAVSVAYVLPGTISVTIGGNAATAGTDYTWTQGTGVLSIEAAKQTGNIVIDVDAVEVGCAADPTVTNEELGLNGEGTFSLSQVDVTTSGWSTGSNTCEWSDYGFVWGTSENPTVSDHKVVVGTSGSATSWNGSLSGTFTAGVTYHYRAYAKNSKTGAEYVYSTTEGTFTPYTVSYNKNDENATGEVATVVVNAGGSVTLPNASAFTLGCNDLTKWALNSADSETKLDPEAPYSNINANAEFYAIWNTRTYTISYVAGNTPTNGGNITGSHDDDTKTCGVSLTLPGVTFYSTGYTQTGWKKTINGASKTNNLSGSYGVDADQTFYPFWTINTYNVTKGTKTGCNGNDFTLSASSVDYYGSITVTASPDNAHKGSAQVSVSPSGNATVSGTTISNIIGDIEVSVSFSAKETASIILHDAGGQSTVSGTHYEMENYTLPNTAASCTESEFYGWYTEAYVDQATAPTGSKYIAKNASKALAAGENHFYAVYATVEDRYTNTYTKITSLNDLTTGDYLISGGSYCMGNTIQSTNRMSETSISANNDVKTTDNESFIWTIIRSGTKVTLYNDNVSRYLAVSGGVIAVQTSAHNFTFDYGTTKANSWTFTSESSPTYQLSYSKITGNSYNYFVMNTTQDTQIDLYKRDKSPQAGAPYTTSPSCTTHTLSPVVDPSSPAGGTVELGKTTVLETKTTTATATPSDHYTFSHWTISEGATMSNTVDGKSTDNPVEVTMGTADATITAHFTEKPKCTVEFYNNGGSAISLTTYWLGETPTAPTLTDGHVDAGGNACDETSTTHYGWTQTAWQQTLTKDDVDAKTAANVKVYTKGSTLPAVTAEDNGKTIKYYAVWAHAEDNSVQKNYTLSLTSDNFPSNYDDAWPNGGVATANEVGGAGTMDVTIDGANIGLYNNIQFKKSSAGYVYNTTDLGNITNIDIAGTTSLSQSIGTTENPSSGTSGGYFKIWNGTGNALNTTGITINFTKTVGDIAYSAFLTNCCNQLEDINGEVEFTDPTTAVVKWDKLENVAATNAYVVSYRTGDAAYGTTNVGAIDLSGAKATCTITDLSCNTSYDFKIAVTAATGYCDKEQVIEGQNSGKYTITSADGGNPTGGTFATLESACSGDNVGLLAEAATGYNFAGWTITKASSGTVSPAADEESTSFTMPAENVTVSAAFNAISYDILYENMDGATNHVSNPSSYTVEDAISLGDPTKEGFNFGGWFINSDLAAGHEAGSPAIAAGSTGNKTFYAKWIADDKWSVAIAAPSHGTITVSWNGGASSFSSGAQNIDKNTDITITATPADGYQLSSLKIGDADFESGNTHKLTSSIVISATFSIINYTISYENMEGATNHEDNVTSYTIESEDVYLYEATKTGYTFGGWFTDEDCTEGNDIVGIEAGSKGNVVVYAKWTAKESTITWDANGGSVDPTSSSYTYDGDAVELPIPTREHYTFDGWFTAAEGGTQITEIGTENKPEADVTYHAHWTEITYTVKWSVNADDTYAEGNPTTSVTYNSKVTTLPTAPTSAECDDAKKFVGWRAEKITGTSATKPDGIFTDIEHSPEITDDVTFYAVFATETVGQKVTLSFPDDNKEHNGLTSNQYTSTWTAMSGEYSWSISNFNNNNWNQNWAYIKCGRKSYASTGTITTSSAIGFPVDTVIVSIGAITAVSVNSAKLYISSASNFETKASMDIEQSTGVKKLVIASPAKDMYYQIEYDCASASSNGIVQVDAITYKQKTVWSDYVTKCASCDDDPTFTTALPAISAEDCTSATVTANGGLATLGSEGCNISDYGFVLSTATNPELDGEGVTKLQVGTSNPTVGNDFSYELTGLTKGTHYYVRAYAINKHGVAYSSTKDFWTKNVSNIAVTTAPTKTKYIVGEAFDATGMVVTATMADGSEVDVTEDVTYLTSAFNAAGNVDFPINYSLCETNVQTTQPINVYSVTVNEGTDPSKGDMTYDNAGTITVSNLASHTTVEFVKENAEVHDNGDGTFSIINPTGTVSITVNYVTAVEVDVKFFANGTPLTDLALNPYQSENFDMPDASAVANAMTAAGVSVSDDVHFVGWSANEFPYQTIEPTMVAETGKVTAATNYYAVFSNIQKVRIDEGVITGSYQSSETEVSAGEFTNGFVHKQVMKSGDKLQFHKGSSSSSSDYGYVYNKAALAYINKIVIGYAAASTFRSDIDVYACSDKKTITGSILVAEERGNTDPYVYRFPDNISYFWVKGDIFYTYVVDYIDIYYAQGTGYYTTQFQTLTFNKANGEVDKTIQKATNDTYALTNADVPSENDTPEGYTFLNKWFDGTDTYAKDAVVTLSSDIVLKPCWDIEINDNATVPAANVEASDITVNEGKTLTLTLTEDTKLGDIIVENGGTLTISGDKKVDAKDFYLEAQEGYSGQVKGNGTIAVNGNAYYDLTLNTTGTMNHDLWYAFAVPFQVDAATGIQRLSNAGVASPAQFNGHYVLLKYDMNQRAGGSTGWTYITAGEKLTPGNFYMVALNSNEYNRLRMKKDAGNVNNKADLTLATTSGSAANKNWNALANNALAYANVSATGDNAGCKVQTYKSADGTYEAFGYGEVTFTVGTPFFIQVAEAGTMSVATGETDHSELRAPQREAVATEEFIVRLGENMTSYYDKIYVSASDEALNEYQIGHDLAKAGVSTKVPQMYIPAYGAKLCDAEFPLVNNEATFPLTFTAPSAGTYQLYVAVAAQDAELYLLRDGDIIWNLTMGAYELTLEQGTNTEYSLLLKAKAPGIATGVDEINGEKAGVQKIVIEDKVFILRGGKMYDVTGKAVK